MVVALIVVVLAVVLVVLGMKQVPQGTGIPWNALVDIYQDPATRIEPYRTGYRHGGHKAQYDGAGSGCTFAGGDHPRQRHGYRGWGGILSGTGCSQGGL